MLSREPVDYLIGALARVDEHLHKHPFEASPGKWPAGRAFTIAFSREAGAQAVSVAREVGTRLGWPVFDQELLQHIARDLNVAPQLLQHLDEKPSNWLQECLNTLLVSAKVNEVVYFRRLIKVLVSLSAQGECIIVGRGAAQFLPEKSTLRVRMVAPLEHRIAVICRQHGYSEREAAQYIETTDRERRRFVKELFLKDAADPLNYDLIINGSRFSLSGCADLVIAALKQRQNCVSREQVATSA